MAVLSTFKSLQVSDFDDKYKDLIGQLAFILNNDIQSIYNALNNQLSLSNNLLCVVKDVPITIDSNGNTTNSANFSIDVPNMRVKGCQVLKVINTTNSSVYPTGAPFISFTPGTQQVTIDHITGLQTGYQWTITVLCWGA